MSIPVSNPEIYYVDIDGRVFLRVSPEIRANGSCKNFHEEEEVIESLCVDSLYLKRLVESLSKKTGVTRISSALTEILNG